MQIETEFKKVHLQKLDAKPIQADQIKGQDHWTNWGQKKLLTYEETCKANKTAPYGNGFFGAFMNAYNNHGDVKFTPDDVWIVIMLYFSKYVNDNSQQLRTAFVSHGGKKKLVVTTHNELLQTQWDEFFTLMIDQIKKNTSEGVTEKFQSNFSTTGRIEKVISTAVIMNTYQKYFSYGRCIPMCGIQNVHFGGTLDDWKNVLQKTQNLMEYDIDGKLKRYVKNITYILEKFIDTYQEKVDLEFWNKIVDEKRGRLGSGSTTKYTGWLINFFGYEGETDEVKIENIGFDIEIDNKMTGVVKNVRLVGGFKAVSGQGMVFRPHLSMAILDA